jgi:hypothetical protein
MNGFLLWADDITTGTFRFRVFFAFGGSLLLVRGGPVCCSVPSFTCGGRRVSCSIIALCCGVILLIHNLVWGLGFRVPVA